MTLKERVAQLKQRQALIDRKMVEISKGATMQAIEKATEMTPTNALAGTDTQTGSMKQSWDRDSVKIPQKQGNSYVTELNSNMKYASFVDEGHDVDRHFVPGLYVNEAGVLEYAPGKKVGIVVGTRTAHVDAINMVDAAKAEFERVSEIEMKKLEELLK